MGKSDIEINLDGLKMNAIETDENGVIGKDTIFTFKEKDQYVTAEYSGGMIYQGYLVGIKDGNLFNFAYCQLEKNNILNNGKSKCTLEISRNGLVRIIENFEWASRPGGGKNIIQELKL